MYNTIPQLKQIKDKFVGVGDKLLLNLVPTFLRNENFTSKQIQCFYGLSPSVYLSGSSVHKKEKISRQGNSALRKILYLSCMSAIQHNQIIKEKYNRLINNGKNKKVALIACMSHLLRAIFVEFYRLTGRC